MLKREAESTPLFGKRLLRAIASLTALIFLWNQIVWAGEILPREYQPNPNQPVVAAVSVPTDSSSPTIKPATSTDFLADKQSPLSLVTQETVETLPEPSASADATHYDYERYEFQTALDLLRPEFATAVIVKKITVEDLKKLAELPFETGVIVLHGEIVLFTSGNESELGILPAASQLIKKATFVSHTHTGGSLVTGPSEFDLAHAGDEEYVITEAGVYAYARTGLLNKGDVYSYGEYIERLNKAVKDSLDEKDQAEARKDLNSFIADQDLYNASSDREVFRRATPSPKVQNFYDTAGKLIRTLTTTYYDGGKVESTDDYRFTAGVKTNRYYTAYDSSGVKIRYITTTYHPDGQTAKVFTEYFYAGGIKTGYNQATYGTTGVKTKDYNVTYYANGTTVKTIDDYRYVNNVRTYLYQTTNDSAGVKTHYITTTYHLGGQTAKAIKDEYYSEGIKVGYNQATHSTEGVKTQDYNVTYYSNGTTVKTIDDYRYVNNIRTYLYQTLNDSSGVKTRYITTAYQTNGVVVKSIGDLYYAGSVKTYRYYTTCNASGSRVHLLIQAFYADGKIKTSDDYNYTAARLKKRVFREYNASGIETSSLTENYPPQILTNITGYTVRYTVDGNSYNETIPLTEGLNSVQRTVTGYNGAPALIEWKITLDTVPPEIAFTSPLITNQENYTLTYTADGIAKTKAFTDLVEGGNALSVTEVDAAGNQSIANWNVTVDTIAPTGSISINAGASNTKSPIVTLDLSSVDVGSEIGTMGFSTDNVNWTTAEAYTTSRTLTLPAGDGSKTVFVKYYDKAGNASEVYSKSILLDTQPPVGTVKVNGGVPFVAQTAVTLNLSAIDTGSGLYQMSFSRDNVTWTAAQTYAATRVWTFAAIEGNKTVYAKFSDKVGLWSAPVSVTVKLDTVKPTGSVDINSGAAYTNSTAVTLNLSGADAGSGISSMSFSTDNVNWTEPEIYAVAKPYALIAGDGSKTIFARLYDKAGNVSTTFSKAITLDTVVPTGSININAGAEYSDDPNVTLTIAATDVTSGLDQMRFSVDDGATWAEWEVLVSSINLTFPGGVQGEATILLQVRDKAGLVTTFTDSISITPATGPTLISQTTLAVNTTWSAARGPYIVQGDVTIPAGIKLTIEPGTTVKFQGGAGLFVKGTLNARGTINQKIIFASNLINAGNYDWLGIRFEGAGSQNSVLEHVKIQNASTGISFDATSPAMSDVIITLGGEGVSFLNGASPTLERFIIDRNNSQAAYISEGCSPVILNSRITNNSGGIEISAYSSGLLDPAPVVHGTVFQGNGYNSNVQLLGFFNNPDALLDFRENWWDSTDVWAINNSIRDHADSDSLSYVDFSRMLDSETGNPLPGVPRFIEQDTSWRVQDSPIYLTSDVTVKPGVTLTIEPGVEIRAIQSAYLEVLGKLNAVGTETNNIHFRYFEDNPINRWWGGIRLSGDEAATSNISNILIEHAGIGLMLDTGSPSLTGLTIANGLTGINISGDAAPRLDDIDLKDNASSGLEIYGTASPVVTNSRFINNGKGVSISDYGYYPSGNGPQPVIHDSIFENNKENNVEINGRFSDPTQVLDFRQNWWGTLDGDRIRNSIRDHFDDANVVYVDYSSMLKSQSGTALQGVDAFITRDTVWTKSISPVFVTSPTFVRPGVTLTIEPGTEVRFLNGAYLLVEGTLISRGTAEDQIRFTTVDPNPRANLWAGIILEGDATSASRISYSTIEYASTGIHLNNSSAAIDHVVSRNNSYGLYLSGSGTPAFSFVVARDNYCGMDIEGWASPLVIDSQFVNNQYGIKTYNYSGEGRPEVHQSRFEGNLYSNVELSGSYPDQSTPLNFKNNWWGTTDPGLINSRIRDGADYGPYPRLDVSSFLISDPHPVSNLSIQLSQYPPARINPNQNPVNIQAHVPENTNWKIEVISVKNPSSPEVVSSSLVWGSAQIDFSWNGLNQLEEFAEDGDFKIRLTAEDLFLNHQGTLETPVFRVDRFPPQGEIQISAGRTATNNTHVELSLPVSDVASDIARMRFSLDKGVSWTPWEAFGSMKSGLLLSDSQTRQWIWAEVEDSAGNVALFKDDIVFDTQPPSGTILINNGAASISSRNVNLSINATDTLTQVGEMQFSVDGGANWTDWEPYKSIKSGLVLTRGDGVNDVRVRLKDEAGNISIGLIQDQIVLDTTPPTGSLMINGGDANTPSTGVELTISVQDSLSGIAGLRYSVDEGMNWQTIDPATLHLSNIQLPAGSGVKTVLLELTDALGNRGIIEDTIGYQTLGAKPDVSITSASNSTGEIYTLTYVVEGVAKSEKWQLAPGMNEILLRSMLPGRDPGFASIKVQQEGALSTTVQMPVLPVIDESSLVRYTVEGGLILKCDQQTGHLISIENPNVFEMFLPELSATNELIGGVILYANNTKQWFKNGKIYFEISASGDQTLYNLQGRPSWMLTRDGKFMRFAYQLDSQDQVISFLVLEDGVTSHYLVNHQEPVWIKSESGKDIRYFNGVLQNYRDVAGNLFEYVISGIYQGGPLEGFRSALSRVTPAGSNTSVAVAIIRTQLDAYPSIKRTLEEDLLKEIQTNLNSEIIRVVSGRNEVLTLDSQLPVSLTDEEGFFSNIFVTRDSQNGIATIGVSGQELGQVFDAEGNLSGIRTSDGTVFSIVNRTADSMALENGSVLSDLTWTGTQLTQYTMTYADGVKERYEIKGNNSIYITWANDGHGNITQYYFDQTQWTNKLDRLTMADGRVYKYYERLNEAGGYDQYRELSRINFENGNYLEFANGNPVRYVQMREIQVDPESVPSLPDNQSYIPLIQFKDAQLRAVTIDQDSNILSGEIDFKDGAQYIIENGKVVRQVTPFGQFLEFSDKNFEELVYPPQQETEPLTASEIAYRNDLVNAQLDYFIGGVGIHEGTGLPLDNYRTVGVNDAPYTQATLVGFWAEILASIAKGDFVTSKMTSLEALQKMEKTVQSYREAQLQIGWKGMLSFFDIIERTEPVLDAGGLPTGENRTFYEYRHSFDNIGFGDNLNVMVSFETVLGALNQTSFTGEAGFVRDRIVATINAVLAAQEQGFDAFYDPSTEHFRGAYAQDKNSFVPDYWIDRLFNEFRTGLILLASKKETYRKALSNVLMSFKGYTASTGETFENAVPFDGGAFQMLWPLIHMDETQYSEFNIVQHNFLYTQADYVNRHGVPGLLTAGDNPGNGYLGKIGVPEAAETDDPLNTTIGSLYGVAAAFPLAPHYALQFLKTLEEKFPQIRTGKGFLDSLRLQNVTVIDPVTGEPRIEAQPVFSTQFFGVDQASFVLSLLRTSQDYYKDRLVATNQFEAVDSIYKSYQFGLTPVLAPNPAPPTLGIDVADLYDGASENPDGLAPALTKQPAYVPTIFDPDYGKGDINNYFTRSGALHHTEIQFEKDGEPLTMDLQEYLLLPNRKTVARLLVEGYSSDIFNLASSKGDFYKPGRGYASSSFETVPPMGEVRRFHFDFLGFNYQNPEPNEFDKAVGMFFEYGNLDLSNIDFLSIPIRLAPGTPPGVRLKFEMKGADPVDPKVFFPIDGGEIFVADNLTTDWQYFTIPVPKPIKSIQHIAITLQTPNAVPAEGDIFLGPMTAFKAKTSGEIDWKAVLGVSDTELRNLLKSKVISESEGGGTQITQEILENFTLDSNGKLVSGTLHLADGSTQYFFDGRLTKWVFKNGRTILYQDGLASFIIDLSRGRLEEGRFYYDRSFRGEVRSFTIQSNDNKRVFNSKGELEELVQDGNIVRFRDGVIHTMEAPEATFEDIVWADDQNLLKAKMTLQNGTVVMLDFTREQRVDLGNGVYVYVNGKEMTGVETTQNGRTTFTYHYDSTTEKLLGIDATFIDSLGQSLTMPLGDYIKRTDRALETAVILEKPALNFLQEASAAGGFSRWPSIPSGWESVGHIGDGEFDSTGSYTFKYANTLDSFLGFWSKKSPPLDLSQYDLISVSVSHNPELGYSPDFQMELKDYNYDPYAALYTFSVPDVPAAQYGTYTIPLEGRQGAISEVTFKLVLESQGVAKRGTMYFQDISFLDLKKYTDKQWQTEANVTADELQAIKVESRNLTAVGASIGNDKPLDFKELVPWLDAPSFMHYSPNAQHENELVYFKRVDGSEVTLSGSNVSRLVLADGTVNEYETTGNHATSEIHGQDAAVQDGGSLEYGYGALRKITQQDGRVYNLAYEFDPADGAEISVVRDERSGEERRFKNGELLRSNTDEALETRYSYQNGVLRGAEVFYKNRVLNSTQYAFSNNETLITDEEGTTWFYDKNGNLTKHLTKDGYLFGYSDFTISTENRQQFVEIFGEDDYKTKILGYSGLQSVSLLGYEAKDGTQVVYGSGGLVEIRFLTGDKAVNVILDENRRIRNGQIQFRDGLVVEIENYLPVRGRNANGEIFNATFPAAQKVDLLIGKDGGYQGVRLDVNGRFYSYDPCGRLIKVESANGEQYSFVYALDASGAEIGYTQTYHKQVDFNGVPYPKELKFEAGVTLKLSSPEMTIAEVPLQGDDRKGFVAAVFVEAANEWKVISGRMSSDGDRILLRQFLENLKDGQSVAMAISDPDFSGISEEILTLLEGLGAGHVRAAASSQSNWFFFGNEALTKGEGREKTGGNSFLTYDETVEVHSLSGIIHPVFEGKSMLAGIPKEFGGAYADFSRRYEQVKPDGEVQAQTVYDPDNRIVFTKRVDGIFSFYEHGKVRETYNRDNELIYKNEYLCLKENQGECADDDYLLSRITLVKARSDFESEQAKLRAQIAQVRYDALYDLAQQHEVADAAVRQGVREGLESLDEAIGQLEAQRFVTVRQCHSTWCGEECSDVTFENPNVVAKINEYQADKRDLLERILPEQIASIPSVIEEKRLEIEAAVRGRLADLDQQAADILRDMLTHEFDPVLTDLYRRVMGRDPSTAELGATVTRFLTAKKIDLPLLQSELSSSAEKAQREADKAAMIAGVRAFLEAYVAALSDPKDENQNHIPDDQETLLATVKLSSSEAVSLTSEEIREILSWLESRDLHFGQSGFLSLRELLLSRGIDVPMVTIGIEAILVDILSGVINRYSKGDLLISVFAFDRVAQRHNAAITGARLTRQELINLFKTACPDASDTNPCALRVIAHIGGDHFAVISSIYGDKLTYMESVKGKDGESKTVALDQFMKMWDTGNGAGHVVGFEDKIAQDKRISDTAAMRVRGAFFPLIWLFYIAVAALVLSVASIVVSFISPTLGKILGYAAMVLSIISIVGSIANFVVAGAKMAMNVMNALSQGVFSAIRQGFAAIGNVIFSAVKAAGQFIQHGFSFLKDVATQGLSALGSGIRAIGSFILPANGAIGGGTLTLGQQLGRQLIASTINFGVSKGLEGLGIDPRLAQLSGAFIGGGIAGMGAKGTTFFRSGLQQFLVQEVSEIGLHLDLPPPITAVLSVAATSSLQTYFNPDLTLKTIITQNAPSLMSKLAMGGIELLGRSMGLDPRISQLIGLTTAAAVGGVTRGLLNPNGMTSLWQSIQNVVLSREVAGGIVSIGAGFVVHELGLDQSLLTSLSSRLVAGAFSDFLASPKNFSLAASIIKSTDESFNEIFDPALLPQLFTAVMDHGLADGIEQYATMIFTRETINEFTSAGMTIGQWIQNSMSNAEDVVYNGQSLKRFRMLQNGKTINFYYVPKGNKLELSMIYEEYANGRRPRLIELIPNEQGRIEEAYVEEQGVDGMVRRNKLDVNGVVKEVTFRDWDGETYARLSFNSAGDLEFTNYALGITDHLSAEGDFTFSFTAVPDFQDFDQLLFNYDANLTPEQKSSLAMFTYGNGFWNQHTATDATSPLMMNFIQKMIQDQAMTGHPGIVLFDQNGNIALDPYGNVLTTASLPIGLYKETGLVGNILNWAANTWLGATFMRDSIEEQYKNYFDLIKLNQSRFGLSPNIPLVHFAHSGDFQPLIQALEHMPDEYREKIKTVVAYGTPYVGDAIINDPYLKTLIRVKGEYDSVPFQDFSQKFQIEDTNGNVRPVECQYNIEILKAGHSDFSYSSSSIYNSEESRLVAEKTSLFMRDLNLVANDKADLEYLLTSNLIPGVHYDSVNKLVTVNPNEYVSPNGAR